MELRIRSQNKEKLCKIENIKYMDTSDDFENDTHSLWNDNNGILGIYKTKQRALEVLDEITNLIKPKYLIRMDNHGPVNDFLNNENNSYVSAEGVGMVSNINQTLYYEMPKE